MAKIHRPTRLIAYDTDENVKRRTRGEKPVYKLVRARTILYVVVIAVVGSLMLYKLTTRQHIGLSVLHVRAPMYTLAHDGLVRNGYTLRFANKWSEPRAFALTVSGVAGATVKSEEADALPDGRLKVTLDPDATLEAQLYVTAPVGSAAPAGAPIAMTITDLKNGETAKVSDHFFGP
jgi:polyferredoxin